MTTSRALERGVRSFYADLRADPGAARVCRGTSCFLAGGAELHPRVDAREARGVYCLGFCDRSPAVLWPDGRVATGGSARAGAEGDADPPPPPVRCLARQAVVTERIARGDFSELARAREEGAYDALRAALRERPERILDALTRSGERGRGGGGFPTGVKWTRCAGVEAAEKFVVANGDEGDPGSFVDRILLERDPHAILEGLALCALAVGAHQGVVYVRSEYPAAQARVRRALEEARGAGILGPSVLGSGFAFDVRLASGHGSYVCGEETALLNALEGRRGEVRLRPPYPVEAGLFGKPTVVNNVETLVNVPWILRRGPAAYRALGTRASPGTKALCLNAGFERPGIVEVEFGESLRRVIEEEAGGGSGGATLDAVALGGPMGSIVPREEWDVALDPAQLRERGIELGHGGLVALPRDTDWLALAEHWLRFMADESCGKCVPCRLGSQRAVEKVRDAAARGDLLELLDTVAATSLCGFGQGVPRPVIQLLERVGGSREPR
ncbi:MAG TPA: NADH-ubiquinone oxidoreductase-F iron-sulfur binding region domain-containing protein [Myxococcota bacterium]|nr:NADH-ubiquinone oxidoreductase-F iron-sulfur binding region domain-containing protein [Myxococcota bacterium]